MTISTMPNLYFRIEAGWPHLILFVQSGALDPHANDCCCVRAGHSVYFATKHASVAEILAQQFDIYPMDGFPPEMELSKPYDTYGNPDSFSDIVR